MEKAFALAFYLGVLCGGVCGFLLGITVYEDVITEETK